jgi:hypothetical protein
MNEITSLDQLPTHSILKVHWDIRAMNGSSEERKLLHLQQTMSQNTAGTNGPKTILTEKNQGQGDDRD